MRFATLADKDAVEAICNHPQLRVWTAFRGAPPCEALKYVTRPSFELIGDEGCFIAHWIGPGRYVVHTNLLPSCRGSKALRVSEQALRLAFLETDCIELLTMVPDGIPQAKLMAQIMGFKHVFNRIACWPTEYGKQNVAFYRMSIDDWIATGICAPSGEWFHMKLAEHVDHGDDPIHDAYVGAAVEMIKAGQTDKATDVYNRWAKFAGYRTIEIVSTEPLRVDIGTCVLRVEGGDFNVEAVHA